MEVRGGVVMVVVKGGEWEAAKPVEVMEGAARGVQMED